MKIGISAFAWTSVFRASHLKLLPFIRDLGFAAVEIPMFAPADLDVVAIRRGCEVAGLESTVCAILPAHINPLSGDKAERDRARIHLTECVKATAEMGSSLLGGPLYAPIGYLPPHRPTKDEWCYAVEIFQSIGSLLDVYNITMSIEPVNRSETFFLRTASEAGRLCDEVGHPRIGVTLDTFHANIEEKSVPAALLSLGARLKHVHASENDRSILGAGHLDFPAAIRALEEIHFNGYLMIEGFGYSADEANAPGALWADTDVSPEDMAEQGFAYLRALLNPS